VPKDDLGELFDVCDAQGRPTGSAKPRGEVHRDGDWHRSLLLWVVLRSEHGDEVVLQRRSLRKETHPGKVVSAVTGHLSSGETDVQALRESEEEIGLAIDPRDVIRLGLRVCVEDLPPAVHERELQSVFGVVSCRRLETLTPNADEVSGLVAVRVEDALALCKGEAREVAARELAGGVVWRTTLRAEELVPVSDGYFGVAMRSVEQMARGFPVVPWRLG
jgi:isopentenyldiphosphate isomerase